ncbi:MAG: biotin--[acetyl-CoA-carboxylase] ligase [Oscillospiraceae bacterium]|nr:biotin--[acetyl-CoA-carboxylase] ligase [Oscillospiraceae bacterium]
MHIELPAGLRLREYECVGSTNAVALEAARAGEAEGLVVVAEKQTAGRGRRGRSFFSPAGTGLYMSVLLRPTIAPERAVLLTAAAASAVCGALEAVFGVRASIKWVNDVLVEGKKVCGILVESAAGTNGLEYAVVGIGVNLAEPEGGFPEELRGIAGAVSGGSKKRGELASEILARLMELYAAIDRGEGVAGYAERVTPPGTRVTVLAPDGAREATVLGTDENCRLLVRYDGGGEDALFSGEISIRI